MQDKKIFIASDHAGFTLKEQLKKALEQNEVIDLGTFSSEESVDYPDYAKLLATKIHDEPQSSFALGILICGSGVGMSIAANRFKWIRAALCKDVEYAKLAREHNDANVIVIGSRFTEYEEALVMVQTFLSTDFAGERHRNRVEKLS